MLAGVWGFLLGGALVNTTSVGVLYTVGAPQWLIYSAGAVVTVSVLIAGVFMLCMEYVNPSVRNTKEFCHIVVLAGKYALLSPLVVPALLILLLTWRWLMLAFIWVYLVPKIRRDISFARSAASI